MLDVAQKDALYALRFHPQQKDWDTCDIDHQFINVYEKFLKSQTEKDEIKFNAKTSSNYK